MGVKDSLVPTSNFPPVRPCKSQGQPINPYVDVFGIDHTKHSIYLYLTCPGTVNPRFRFLTPRSTRIEKNPNAGESANDCENSHCDWPIGVIVNETSYDGTQGLSEAKGTAHKRISLSIGTLVPKGIGIGCGKILDFCEDVRRKWSQDQIQSDTFDDILASR